VWVARNPPGFAFVEFEDPRDAEDAVRGLDGRCVSKFLSNTFILLAKAQGLSFVELLGENIKSYT
jgi:RNA recognition motif-containing protein